MLSRINSCTLLGLNGQLTKVEIDLYNGIPGITVVGLADISVKESKDRIKSAIKNSGIEFPDNRITVNLAPASIKKAGSHYDMPIAVGILQAMGAIKQVPLGHIAFIGELSLNGNLNPIRGALPLALELRKNNIKEIVVPKGNLIELAMVKDMKVYAFNTLYEVIKFLNGELDYKDERPIIDLDKPRTYNVDFNEVCGQEYVKRAMEIGAAGGHNLMMIGPPGAGKSMMAKRFPTILPSPTYEECLEITKIYSVAGLLSDESPIMMERPFRSPHHTISNVGLVGGGSNLRPGEVSLAHYGVLFLDEFPEFKKSAIDVLRQPIEDEIITISRASGTVTYPASVNLILALNPCKCGYFGQDEKCSCTPNEVRKYLSKVSGPILDRVDMHIQIYPVEYDELNDYSKNKSSSDMRVNIEKARKIQLERYKNDNILYNSQLNTKLMDKYCNMEDDAKYLLKNAFDKLGFSARAYTKLVKLGRTIADLEESENILASHVAEAIQYRKLDKNYWNMN